MDFTTSTGTLAPGASQTFDVVPGAALTVVFPPNSRATITENVLNVTASFTDPNASDRTIDIQYPGTHTFGPYPLGATVTVAMSARSTATSSYTFANTAAELIASAVDTIDADGQSDSVILEI